MYRVISFACTQKAMDSYTRIAENYKLHYNTGLTKARKPNYSFVLFSEVVASIMANQVDLHAGKAFAHGYS